MSWQRGVYSIGQRTYPAGTGAYVGVTNNNNTSENSSKMKPKRLGRGLMDLIGEQALSSDSAALKAEIPQADGFQASEIPVQQISPNPKQPRRTFDESDLEELAASIRVKGVLQAILVRPDPEKPSGYQIVAGERRWRRRAQSEGDLKKLMSL